MAHITPQNTTIVLVHGAFQSPYHYEGLTTALKELGWTLEASQLPSVGNESASFDADVAVARKDIEAALAKGKDVAIIAHSWGGIIAGEACKGFQKVEGASKPGVVRIVYLCAFVLHLGYSLSSSLGEIPEWQQVSKDGKYMLLNREADFLYNDFADPKLAQNYVSRLKPQGLGSLQSKTTWEPYKEIQTAYVLCNKDKAIPVELQEKMIKDAMITQIVRLDASHTPWVMKKNEVVQAILDAFAGKL